jgi:hypothetical protein
MKSQKLLLYEINAIDEALAKSLVIIDAKMVA